MMKHFQNSAWHDQDRNFLFYNSAFGLSSEHTVKHLAASPHLTLQLGPGLAGAHIVEPAAAAAGEGVDGLAEDAEAVAGGGERETHQHQAVHLQHMGVHYFYVEQKYFVNDYYTF